MENGGIVICTVMAAIIYKGICSVIPVFHFFLCFCLMGKKELKILWLFFCGNCFFCSLRNED